MATITGFTADRMLAIENASVVDGEIRADGHLWLTKHDGSEIDAGPVLGPPGPTGAPGPSSGIPGEVRLWSGSALPDLAKNGKWVWADGAVYPVAATPLAAANIATQWRTFGGASDPGVSNFRVPDIRGLAPVGMDAMPGGARANRMTRAVAITIAARTGEETHIVSISEIPVHAHGPGNLTVASHAHGGGYHDHGGGQHRHAMANFQYAAAGSDPNYDNARTGANQQTLTDWSGAFITPQSVIAAEAPAVNAGATTNNGGGGAHENVQPSVFVPYIVCLNG
jgi:microcystin-dependent protein